QGTPKILGEMLVEMGAKSLASRGKKPAEDAIRYAWHYSQAAVADQNSWRLAGEAYIAGKYPRWVNVAPANYYSRQDPQIALRVGEDILANHQDIDLIICNDSTALPGQCQAAENMNLGKNDVTITGFAAPNAIKGYCRSGVIERWGLWDCQTQGALGCYFAYYLASGNSVKVGDKINVPHLGEVEVLPNTVLDPGAYAAPDSGIVLMPERVEFTLENMDNYDF
ncbi:MAG: substrate-binding domain-containing protein, partial [Planctomycetota bacterium]|nr:substrate-binding domain-containing protein [Planctomycetota bacterium]